jgi:antitoxin (DNA-binding transcriptional repressor) of toxin-antitoxin stability system
MDQEGTRDFACVAPTMRRRDCRNSSTVEKGEQIVITRHGRPVARLVPEVQRNFAEALTALDRITARRKALAAQGVRITQAEIREWREEGRRQVGRDARLRAGCLGDRCSLDRGGSVRPSASHTSPDWQRQRYGAGPVGSGGRQHFVACRAYRLAQPRGATRSLWQICPVCRSLSTTRRQGAPGRTAWPWRRVTTSACMMPCTSN